MTGDTRKLPAAEAILFIQSCSEEGRRVLGVDGFQVVPDGYIARLDLILDLSREPMTPAEAVRKADEFVVSQGAPDILFEIVVEHSGGM